ncbi:hypothetical protein [Mycolicibacterium fallax]|uniref:Uncharacterized protein n=1 Tax=Mycolicibacterium fallax TaxID=1793 RepID=A0A1X1RFM0_MYCFA|nr:hypothetical protein [Mycolicibacterium fallax]ORV04622.1 hypothetical protein AWC04_08495 [Mycolicibacterium fallax]BBY99631.1 hypothetical protein MFAL_30980 [Mycolicibacterium fallax]
MNNHGNYDPAYMQQPVNPTSDYDELVAEIQRLDEASEQKGMQALITIGASIVFGIVMVVIDRPISLVIAAFGIGMGVWLAREGGELSNAADELRSQLPATPPSAHTEYVTLPDGRVIPRDRYEDIASRNPSTPGNAPNGQSQGNVNNSFDDISDEDGF